MNDARCRIHDAGSGILAFRAPCASILYWISHFGGTILGTYKNSINVKKLRYEDG